MESAIKLKDLNVLLEAARLVGAAQEVVNQAMAGLTQ